MQERKPGPPGLGDKPSFEAAFEKLQTAVKKLESGELSLEDSLQQFEEGVRLTRICQDYLNAAEQRVDVLMKGPGAPGGSSEEGGQPQLQPFRK
jgi:exodeoxyribonuclease VII small subunit